MDPEQNYVSESLEATEALAESIGRAAFPGLVIALSGELGSGKTAFVRGLARGLDVEDPVSSPTFTLMHSYRGRLDLAHYDAWMEGRERALLLDGGAEELAGAGVSVIEWAENVLDLLPEPYLAIRLAHRSPETRSIRIVAVGTQGTAVAGLLGALRPPAGIRAEDADSGRGAP